MFNIYKADRSALVMFSLKIILWYLEHTTLLLLITLLRFRYTMKVYAFRLILTDWYQIAAPSRLVNPKTFQNTLLQTRNQKPPWEKKKKITLLTHIRFSCVQTKLGPMGGTSMSPVGLFTLCFHSRVEIMWEYLFTILCDRSHV